MNLLRTIITAAAVLALTGCAYVHTEVVPLSSKSYDVKSKDCTILVLTQMPTDRKYEELSILNVAATVSLDGMLPSIKEKACAVGADAVVIKSSTLPTQKQPAQAYVVAIKFL